MVRQLVHLGLNYTIPAGVDHRLLSDLEITQLTVANGRFHEVSNKYIRSAISAACSHLQIYAYMVDKNLPYALIMEDDVVLPAQLAAILDQIVRIINSGDVYLLRYYSHFGKPLTLTTKNSIPIGVHGECHPPVNIDAVASAAAYVVTLDFARCMLEKYRPVEHFADEWGRFYKGGAFKNLYCVYPQVMSDGPFVPTIEYPATRSLLNRLKSALRQYSPVNRLVRALRVPKTPTHHKIVIGNDEPFWLRSD